VQKILNCDKIQYVALTPVINTEQFGIYIVSQKTSHLTYDGNSVKPLYRFSNFFHP